MSKVSFYTGSLDDPNHPSMVAAKLRPPPSTDPRDYVLTPRQFAWFTALHRYDDASEAVLAALKDSDNEVYAVVKADLVGAKTYIFETVLAVLADKSVQAVIPKGVDVTEKTLSARWLEAAAY